MQAQVTGGVEVGAELFSAAVLGDAVAAVFRGADLLGVGDGDEVDVAPRTQAGIASAVDITTVGDVTTGIERELLSGTDPAGGVEMGDKGAVALLSGVGGAFVDDVAAHTGEIDVTATDLTGHRIADTVAGQQADAVTGADRAAIEQAAIADSGQILRGFQGAHADDIATADQVDIPALHQAAAPQVMGIDRCQVQHRHQHVFALHLAFFHPHDVVGQGRHLLRGEADADTQLQAVTGAEAVVHQVAELFLVTLQPGEKALPGLRQHGVTDQAAFVIAVPQAPPGFVVVVADLVEQVLGTEKAGKVGEEGIGFNQVGAARIPAGDKQPVFTAGQLEFRRLGQVFAEAIRAQFEVVGVVACFARQLRQGVFTQGAVLQVLAGLQVEAAAGLQGSGIDCATILAPGRECAGVAEPLPCRARLEFGKAHRVERRIVEGRQVVELHLVPQGFVDAPGGADDGAGSTGLGGRALVDKAVGGEVHVAIGGEQAVAVFQGMRVDTQVFAGHQSRGLGGVGRGGFAPGFADIDGAALEAVVAVAVLAADPLDAAADQFAFEGKVGAGVFELAGVDVQVAFGFHAAGEVTEARAAETEITDAVEITFEVAEMLAAHVQVAAAEQQAGVGDAGSEQEMALAADAPMVIQLSGIDLHMPRCTEHAEVVQYIAHAQLDVLTAEDLAVVLGEV